MTNDHAKCQPEGDAAGAAAAAAPARPVADAAAHCRFMQGEFEITVVSDGYISIPEEILVTDGTADQRAALLARLDRSGGMVMPKANIPVLRKGSEVILIDIGSGRKYQPTDGQLDEN